MSKAPDHDSGGRWYTPPQIGQRKKYKKAVLASVITLSRYWRDITGETDVKYRFFSLSINSRVGRISSSCLNVTPSGSCFASKCSPLSLKTALGVWLSSDKTDTVLAVEGEPVVSPGSLAMLSSSSTSRAGETSCDAMLSG